MFTLIIGGSGSGKSAYAESCMTALPGHIRKYYIATMQVFDREGEERVARHRRMRSGKGMITLEQPTSVCAALKKMETGAQGRAALLECMSNLTANEMFSGETYPAGEAVAEKVLRDVELLYGGLSQLVVVTNNVAEDGIRYDGTTMEYIRALGLINQGLAARADRVVEVVAGIPVEMKGGAVCGS